VCGPSQTLILWYEESSSLASLFHRALWEAMATRQHTWMLGSTRQAVGTKPSEVTPWGEERRERSGQNPTDRVNQQATRLNLPSPGRREALRVSTTGKVWAKA